ncbi:DUF2834 domain-containing protein [Nevskia sp.]|uniref:DUF2834 domain-containing protein n=1 Tax=Nevskia sp. TaxID=1929292 RepID=UPI0025D1A6D2|nr:DUF2834 domain-containing protein [Nevskia sp.]
MNLPRPILFAILLPFSILSAYALKEVGYLGIFTAHFHPAGLQVLTDLVIALTLVMVWMVGDARARGVTVWPYIVATLALGSFGPLAYLLVRGSASNALPVKSWA